MFLDFSRENEQILNYLFLARLRLQYLRPEKVNLHFLLFNSDVQLLLILKKEKKQIFSSSNSIEKFLFSLYISIRDDDNDQRVQHRPFTTNFKQVYGKFVSFARVRSEWLLPKRKVVFKLCLRFETLKVR